MTYYILFFFFNDTATTVIYTLSLHDALPISPDPGVALFWYLATSALSSMSFAQSMAMLCDRSEEHTSELQSHSDLVCRLLLEKKNTRNTNIDSKTIKNIK